ncbi:DegT/DnrJ/EryC1/StrS family aminotransferase [Pseudonocardia sp. K10HN5]|uniref:DegT/DnrJ/EryC1/StrS family aminotransferase n=2 Tax=Pseudonocardia acidicola TaxID=2724939 RepID=A0ABX1S6I5_9PSEU|nr:DegT/DnrJ/EryC1/StrS family aminotransferase [Pseudonocardia acidicola]
MFSSGMREMAAAVRVLAKGDLARYGNQGVSEVQRFEDALRATIGVEHALAVNSGTSALICALVGAGVGPGDEVLVPAYTWVSTAAAPLAVGAVPVLVEIDSSLTIDPADITRKITPHTKAIIPVHMLNLVCDMGPIMAIAEEHGLVVIEDACQAVGLTYRGRRVGSIGHAGAFSFNQHKNIRSGEGGALLTNDRRLYARASMYHDVGSYERTGWAQGDVPLVVGVNYRMPELSAAILRPQLARLDAQLARRRARRRLVIDELGKGPYSRAALNPHHDPDAAAGLAISFPDPEQAAAFGGRRGARRLIDTGRHVYTNWQSVLARNPHHPRLDPYAWAHREFDHGPRSCPETLGILARTCTVELAPELPTPAFRMLARGLAR